MTLQRHPLDASVLKKGDYISPQRCEMIVGVDRKLRDYPLALVKLMDQIRDLLLREGKEWVLRTEKDGIRILVDSEAAVFTGKVRFRQGMRVMARAHRSALAVDTSNLTQLENKDHAHQLDVNGKVLQAVRVAKKLALRAHRRKTPKLVTTGDDGDES